MADPRVVIVTGAANGIGYSCAQKFYEAGDNVVLADIDNDAGAEAISRLGAEPDRAIFVACDVSKKLAVNNLMAKTLSQFGQIDILVNNAGIFLPGGSLDLSIEDFDHVIAVNLRGAFLVAREVAQYFAEIIEDSDDRSSRRFRPYSIINMSSINAQVAIANALAYSVSKGGLMQMTKAMALELAPLGIRVNAVGPGSIKTAMLGKAASDDEAMAKIQSRTPLGRLAVPEEIANIVFFLASEGASYITGETIYADGGRLALNYTMPAD